MNVSRPSVPRYVVYLSLIASIVLSACSAGLQPAHTASSGVITITLSGASVASAHDAANARAIASGPGFLYLQTGLAAQSATLFGPYPVSTGATVTVTDIPTDTYPAIVILFLPTLPTSPVTPIIPTESTAEGLRLAAAAALASSPDVSSAASVGLVEDFTVRTGKRNELSATLVPTTALAPDEEGTLAISGTAGATTRRFIRLSGLVSSFASAKASDAKTLTMTLSHTGAELVSVPGVGLYTSQGLVVLRENPAASLAAGTSLSRSVAWTGGDVYYAYVEFSGSALTCLFEASVTRQCAITYDANGGTGTVASQLVEEGSSTVLAAGGFTRDGYSFLGWSTNASASVPDYAAGATFTVGSVDVTLYAVWQANLTNRAVRFNANGGTGSIAEFSGPIGSQVTLPSGGFTRGGYSFIGWSTNASASVPDYAPGATFTVGSADVTLYAIWQADATTSAVRFNANGGTGSIAELSGSIGSQVTLPSGGFTRAGYTFLGWALSSTATSYDYAPSTLFTVGSSDALLYAVWSDLTAPTITSASFPTTYINTTTDLSVSLSANEPGSGIKGITLSGAFASYSTPTVQVGESYETVSFSGGTLTFANPVVTTETITIIGITLTTGAGTKAVQIQLSDDAGNVSVNATATVTVDITPPTLNVTLANDTYPLPGTTLMNDAYVYTTGSGQLSITATDTGGSGVLGFSGSGWNVVGSNATFQVAGAAWLSVQDNAGNTTVINFTTVLDITPPAFGTLGSSAYDRVAIVATDMESGPNSSDCRAYYSNEFPSEQSDPSTITNWHDASYEGSLVQGLINDSTTLQYVYIRVVAFDNVGNTSTRYIRRYDNINYYLLP